MLSEGSGDGRKPQHLLTHRSSDTLQSCRVQRGAVHGGEVLNSGGGLKTGGEQDYAPARVDVQEETQQVTTPAGEAGIKLLPAF